MGMNEIRRMDKVPSAAESKRYMEELMSLYKNSQVKTKDTSEEQVESMPFGTKEVERSNTAQETDIKTSIEEEEMESSTSMSAEDMEENSGLASDVQKDIDRRYPSPPAFVPLPLKEEEPPVSKSTPQEEIRPEERGNIVGGIEAVVPERGGKESEPPRPIMEYSADICKNPESTCGFWQGHVFAGRQAIPIKDAVVFITRETEQGQVLEYILTTDESGETKEVALVAPDPALSLSPEAPPDPPPYSTYTTMVYAEGFYPVESHTAAIFAWVHSIQPITLTPLQESYSSLPNLKLSMNGGE